jgi:hypothetical protein
MVEYGGGISQGPAGQVSGGTSPFGNSGGVDAGASIGNLVNDAVNTISTLGPIELVALVALVFLGLIILRRAF